MDLTAEQQKLLSTWAPDPISKGEAIARGAAQGLTFGFADEAEAKFYSWKNKVPYEQAIKTVRDRNEEVMKAHPALFTVSEVGSSAVFGLPGLGRKLLTKTAVNVAGGIVGGLGTTEAELSHPEAWKSAAKGGALQGTLGVAGEGVGALARRVRPDSLAKYAEQKAVSATGALTPERRKLNEEQQQKLGRFLLDNKIVKIGTTPEMIANKAYEIVESEGKKIGGMLKSVDDNVKEIKKRVGSWNISDKQKVKFNKEVDTNFQIMSRRLSDRIMNEIVDPVKNNPISSKIVKNEIKKMEELANDLRDSNKAGTLLQAHEAKRLEREKIDFMNFTIPETYKKKFYNILQTELEQTMDRALILEEGLKKTQGVQLLRIGTKSTDEVPLGAIGRAYIEAKKKFGPAKTLTEIYESAADRLRSNRTLGMSENLAMIQGAATGDLSTGLAMGVAQKGIKTYGDSWAAVGADRAAKAMTMKPFKFGRALTEAAAKGPAAFMGTHLYLMQNSQEYRDELKIIDQQLEQAKKTLEKYNIPLQQPTY